MVSATELRGCAVVGWALRDVTWARVDCCDSGGAGGLESRKLSVLIVEWSGSWFRALHWALWSTSILLLILYLLKILWAA
jgi:hypothetical protein